MVSLESGPSKGVWPLRSAKPAVRKYRSGGYRRADFVEKLILDRGMIW